MLQLWRGCTHDDAAPKVTCVIPSQNGMCSQCLCFARMTLPCMDMLRHKQADLKYAYSSSCCAISKQGLTYAYSSICCSAMTFRHALCSSSATHADGVAKGEMSHHGIAHNDHATHQAEVSEIRASQGKGTSSHSQMGLPDGAGSPTASARAQPAAKCRCRSGHSTMPACSPGTAITDKHMIS